MQYLSDQEVVSTLARLMIQAKSPYELADKSKYSTVLGWGVSKEGLQSKVEVVSLTSKGMDLDCIQDVLTIPNKFSKKKVRKETTQFNELMEKLQMPVFMWHNKERQTLELHWQESLSSLSDMVIVHRMFEQSTLLRNSMEKRLRLSWQQLSDQMTVH